MWELDCEESWLPKNWCFWTVVLEKTLESPLDSKEIQSVHPKGDQSWVFIGRTDAEDETPIFWPPHVKSWLIGKDSDAGTDWWQEEKGTTEDEMARWHHRLDGHEFELNPGVGDEQGRLVCWFIGSQRVGHMSDWTKPSMAPPIRTRPSFPLTEVKSSQIGKSCPTLVTPWTIAYQVPPSKGFSRQEYWSGLPFPSPGDLPDPWIEPGSPTL